jgi:G3E family GTPase
LLQDLLILIDLHAIASYIIIVFVIFTVMLCVKDKENLKMQKIVPIHILSGFLGSGKTTLLKKAVDYYTESGRKPAVIMNELGDVNLDGLLLGDELPMAEMLSGCICCTIRGDLGMTIHSLYLENQPDVIFIESTGVANPMEIMDGVTDASLLLEVELKSIVTVIDAPYLLELSRGNEGKTFRLMKDQIRCASFLLMNKVDKVSSSELHGLERMIRSWNSYAPIQGTVYCNIDIQLFDELSGTEISLKYDGESKEALHEHGEDHNHEHNYEHEGEHLHTYVGHSHGDKDHHHSHDHVMVYTHYFDQLISRNQFEELIRKLPQEVYRAKGILQFSDTASSRFLFQYAYREIEFIKITPQAIVPNVAVFMGENFSRDQVKAALDEL